MTTKSEGDSHKSRKTGDSVSPHGNRGKGRPKGAKNKATLVKEAVMAKIAPVVAEGSCTPLEAMIRLVTDAQAAYVAALAVPASVDEDSEKARVGALRRARADLLEASIAAAPYLHAKLASIDQKSTGSLTVVVETGDGDGS